MALVRPLSDLQSQENASDLRGDPLGSLWGLLRDARSWIGSLVALGLLVLVARDVRVEDIQHAWSHADYGYLAAGAITVALGGLLRAMRWRLLFAPRCRPSLRPTVASVWAGQLVNLVVPFKAGELVRALYLSDVAGAGKVYVLSTVAVERAFDGLIVLILAASLAPAVAFPGWFDWSGVTSTAALACLLVVMVLLARYKKALVDRLGKARPIVSIVQKLGFASRLRPAVDALDALAEPRLLLAMWGLTCLIWLLGGLANHLVLISLGRSLPFAVSLFVLLALSIGVSVPSLPWQVGLFETIAMLSLMAFGVDQASALSYGVLLHLAAQGPPTLLGAISLHYLERARRRSSQRKNSLAGAQEER